MVFSEVRKHPKPSRLLGQKAWKHLLSSARFLSVIPSDHIIGFHGKSYDATSSNLTVTVCYGPFFFHIWLIYVDSIFSITMHIIIFKQGNIATALIVQNTGTISGFPAANSKALFAVFSSTPAFSWRRPEPSQLDFLRTGTNGESIGTNEDQK